MRFAFKTANQYSTWAEILAVWKEADAIELFESGWLFDHFYPISSPQQPEPDLTGPCLEGWTMLAALAQATSRLRLGLLVTGIHYRHPAVLANMAATTDIISGGRLELGVGAGWNEQESGAYGIELGTMRERLDRFDEACEVIISMLSQEVTNYDGEYFQLTEARCEPRPRADAAPADRDRRRRREADPARRRAPRTAVGRIGGGVEPATSRASSSCCGRTARRSVATRTRSPRRATSGSTPPSTRSGTSSTSRAGCDELGVDLAIVYLAPPISPSVLRPLAEALAPLR